MADRVKLTKTTVAKVEPVEGRQVLLWDAELRGFGLRVSPGGAKSFIFQRRIGKRERRVTIGRAGEISAEAARKKALGLASQFADGFDPVKEAEVKAAQEVTLRDAFESYIAAPSAKGGGKGKSKKERTIRDIRFQMTRFDDWLNLPLAAITEDMVKARHVTLAKVSPAQANLCFRYLRAAINYAIADSDADNPVLARNPVDRLNRTKQWAALDAAKGYVATDNLAEYVATVQTALIGTKHEREHRDAILFILLTGCRHAEVMGDRKSGYEPLRWDRVNLDRATAYFPEPKNRRPFTVYLSRQLVAMLRARHEVSGASAYVFANAEGVVQEDLRDAHARIAKASGIKATSHDLRRTFISAANRARVPAYTMKALVNHATGAGDVTAGYVQVEEGDLREAAQAVADYILSPARTVPNVPTDNVVKMEARG